MMQYYYKNNSCSAESPNSADCRCWHDEGTGPFASARYDRTSFKNDVPSEWRKKPMELSIDERDETDPVILWAEIHKLREEIKGPDGYQTWKDAAVDERIKRVKAEKELKAETEKSSDELDLRDIFASDALTGIIGRSWDHFKGSDMDLINQWAKSSYLVADAMLKARAK